MALPVVVYVVAGLVDRVVAVVIEDKLEAVVLVHMVAVVVALPVAAEHL